MTEFFTDPMFIIATIVVIAVGGYGVYAWLQQKWPFDSR